VRSGHQDPGSMLGRTRFSDGGPALVNPAAVGRAVERWRMRMAGVWARIGERIGVRRPAEQISGGK